MHDSGLLDSPPEESFDALTRLAARLLRVPSSFVSVVDAQRDFYKSQTGFAPPLAEDRQIEGRTFCHYTLASDEPLVIGDTHGDPVWRAVPTVDLLGVRAYVGVPIKLRGETVGSLCVIDHEPRHWDADDLETLRQIALSASRELALRTALAHARDESQRAFALARSREEVVAVVAHDLRTPLQVLKLSADLLRHSAGADSAQDAVLRRMHKSIDAMETMAEGLLSSSGVLAPLAAGREAVAVKTLVEDALDMMRPIAARAGIHLSAGAVAEGSARVDFSLMLRVLGNLLGNGIKYCDEGSLVRLGAQRVGSNVLLTVSDNGPGMTVQEQAHVFESGWQGTAGMVRGDGAGLGLSIVKKLVEDQGGRVDLRSSPEDGTAITVTVPAA